MDLPLPLLLGDPRGLVLGEPAAHGTGESGAKVEREVFLVLVEQAQLGALVGVDDGEDTGDRLADVAAVLKSPVSIRFIHSRSFRSSALLPPSQRNVLG